MNQAIKVYIHVPIIYHLIARLGQRSTINEQINKHVSRRRHKEMLHAFTATRWRNGAIEEDQDGERRKFSLF